MNFSQFLRLLWRRKWLFIVPLVVTPALALALTSRQAPTYQAEAQVLLSYRDIAGGGVDSSSVQRDAKRNAETQARLARVPAVAERVVEAQAGLGLTAAQFLAKSEVTSSPNADLLTFTVRDGDAGDASLLATEYGRQFTGYRQQLDTAAVTRARQEVEARIKALRDQGGGAEVSSALLNKAEELRTLEALQTSNAFLVQEASRGEQVAPQPIRTAAFATFVALLLAVGLVLLVDALDNRTRTVDELGARLGLARLGRIPRPTRRGTTSASGFVEADSVQADSVRMLRTNLDFQNVDGGVRTIMVTSAGASEGKSTTLTNLAMAYAKAGRRTVLVDLDLRRPVLHRHFQLPTQPGLTDVALGKQDLEEALFRTEMGGAGDSFSEVCGCLDVLVAGALPPDPGEFVGSGAVAAILARLQAEYEVVLIDAPPALAVSDALTLSNRVDGVLVVCNLTMARRPAVAELRSILEAMPTKKLGFVVTGERLATSRYYGYAGQEAPGGRPGAAKRATQQA